MINNLVLISSFSGVSLGIVASIILLFSNKTQKSANRLLALTILSLVAVMLAIFLFEWNAEIYAYIYRFPAPLLYSIFPAGYLYVRLIIYNESRLRKKDGLHFLPAFLYMVEMIPHYFSSYQYRLSLVRDTKNKLSKFIELNEGLLPDHFNLGFLCIQSICYVILIIILLKKKELTLNSNNSGSFRWMKIFVYMTGIIALPMIFAFPGSPVFVSQGIESLLVILTFSFLIIKLCLFFQPEILYGIAVRDNLVPVQSRSFPAQEDLQEKNNEPQDDLSREDKNPSDPLSESSQDFPGLATYKPILESFMQSRQPFLKQGYSIQDLSAETGIPQHHLSALLNRVYKQRFTDYINGMRICYIARNFGNAHWENLTLEGIAKQVGFTSRTTFFNAIKKTTGVAPSEFIELLKKKDLKTHLVCTNLSK